MSILISIKGVLLVGGKVVQVGNDRKECEPRAGYARSIESWGTHAEP